MGVSPFQVVGSPLVAAITCPKDLEMQGDRLSWAITESRTPKRENYRNLKLGHESHLKQGYSRQSFLSRAPLGAFKGNPEEAQQLGGGSPQKYDTPIFSLHKAAQVMPVGDFPEKPEQKQAARFPIPR